MPLAKTCGVTTALGDSDAAKLALWQVPARVLAPATSLLGMIRLATTCTAARLLGIKDSFNEDDLHANGAWLAKRQPKVEAKLWQSRPPAPDSKGLFFYDVTSSNFEGTQNALAEFGYNRDQIKGKKQVVMGLLTDAQGEPVSVRLFPGNTSDLRPFGTQVTTLKDPFDQV